jgi:hypothetical protein
MTLDKHQIDGLPAFTQKTLPAEDFESRMTEAGYTIAGSAPAKGNRMKIWWVHTNYRRVESIYSSDQAIVITAYHV